MEKTEEMSGAEIDSERERERQRVREEKNRSLARQETPWIHAISSLLNQKEMSACEPISPQCSWISIHIDF